MDSMIFYKEHQRCVLVIKSIYLVVKNQLYYNIYLKKSLFSLYIYLYNINMEDVLLITFNKLIVLTILHLNIVLRKMVNNN